MACAFNTPLPVLVVYVVRRYDPPLSCFAQYYAGSVMGWVDRLSDAAGYPSRREAREVRDSLRQGNVIRVDLYQLDG